VSKDAEEAQNGLPTPPMMSQNWESRPATARHETLTHAPTATDDDAPFVRRCRAGDTEAYGVLVERHEARVRALAARILGPVATREDIDDVAQDVFVQAWRALPKFRGEALFATWLHRLATNMAIKAWHRQKKRALETSTEGLPAGMRAALTDSRPGPDSVAMHRAQERALRLAVEGLPEKQRVVVLLHYFEAYSCEDVAQMVGCSVGTVWSRLHYACRRLRGALDWLEAE